MGRPFDPRDRFFRKAKAEGYRARSAFKLKEIVGRQRLLRKGAAVLDLGAAPGGFLQVLAESVGEKGKVVGVDLQRIEPLDHPAVTALEADVYADDLVAVLQKVHAGRFDAVVSDMAPATTGASATDVARSHGLVERAQEIAELTLRPGGAFVAKVFMGPGFDELVVELRRRYDRVKIVRPEATRTRSRECFLVGTGFRPPVAAERAGEEPAAV